MSSADVALHVALLHADVVAGAAAKWEHPLLLVHMERHVADELRVQLRLEAAHMAAGQRNERRKEEDCENEERKNTAFTSSDLTNTFHQMFLYI